MRSPGAPIISGKGQLIIHLEWVTGKIPI
ncbi:uncharacterized protein METZ01_LOCUS184090 [marine metagenome]|uniref:Uncharacterized protein n=1 Tax=marine metagenome TaxID=408172 RepID=A0A382CYD8_9ZZZZ